MNINMQELETVSNILAAGLAKGADTIQGVPFEVACALNHAHEQMRHLPVVIDELSCAWQKFATVGSAIRRLIEISNQAASMTAEESRSDLETEFVNLAKIIAADGGRQYYQGPALSIKTKGEALSAAKIMGYMQPVVNTMEEQLKEQTQLIYEAISETLSFLTVVTQCYPEAEGAGALDYLVN
ncbi:MAG: hypothetical protein ACRCTY_06825, partial [Candidatus Adiutrix sp.]